MAGHRRAVPAMTWLAKRLGPTLAYAGGVPMKSRLPISTPHWRTMA